MAATAPGPGWYADAYYPDSAQQRWWDGSAWTGYVRPAPARPAPVVQQAAASRSGTLSAAQRTQLLDAEVSRQVLRRGARVESHGDFVAVLVKGKPVNHLLHFLIAVVTFATWAFVWLFLVLFGGEKRFVLEVDERGAVRRRKA